MKKKYLISSIFILILSTNLLSCNLNSSEDINSNIDAESSQTNSEIFEKTYINPYTGKETKTDPNTRTPFMAIVENSKASRPQSGLSYADIVYETSAEGGIPRFISIFHSNYPDKIGPIRSARPYFVTIANEFSLPFAHCGGSKEALNKISSDTSIMSINEMYNSKYFYRDNNRVAPHNLYTSSNNIINSISDKNFNPSHKEFLKYDSKAFSSDSLKVANTINIKCNNLYSTSYEFKNGRYEKSMDGEPSYDALTGKPLAFDNIVVQKTNITLQPDGSHLDVDLISEGDGYIFSNGKVKEIRWKKNAEFTHTKLLNLDGSEVNLSPGTTIWNIIDNSSPIDF